MLHITLPRKIQNSIIFDPEKTIKGHQKKGHQITHLDEILYLGLWLEKFLTQLILIFSLKIH